MVKKFQFDDLFGGTLSKLSFFTLQNFLHFGDIYIYIFSIKLV